MDSSSWIHGYAANGNDGGGSNGFMCGYPASCVPSVLQCREQQQHEVLLGSQIQQHLNQINMHMNSDDIFDPAVCGHGVASGDISSVVDDLDFLPNSHHAAGGYSLIPFSPSTFSSFGSASLTCSPGISSTAAHVLAAPALPEVSSQAPLLPYDDQHYHQHAVNFHDTPAAMAPGGSGMSMRASSFRRYERHISPRPRLTKPACGQRVFKTAMLFLHKMHSDQVQKQKEYYYQHQEEEEEEAAEQSENKVQHMITERKRRDRINESFQALRAVLPPGSKKDKTSVLIIARDYVNSLKSKVRELEEKNQALRAELDRRPTSGEEDEDESGAKVEIQITAAADEGDQSGDLCTVSITAPPRGKSSNTTNVVLRTLQSLKDEVGEDVNLVSVSTCDDDGDGRHRDRASLTLQLKSAAGAKWDEKAVREAVTKAMVTAETGAGRP